ncbi:VOC family protein [Paenimyroides ceti]
MSTQVFINLPVADLPKAIAFYTAIGFTNNPDFSDHTAACMVYSNEIFVMLLTHDKFKEFINRPMADARKTALVIHSLSMENMDKVNAFVEKAVAAGGKETMEPQDLGFMQQRSIEDLDGHLWEVFYMDMSAMPQQ